MSASTATSAFSSDTQIAFIGGGNMAKAIVGGLRRGGLAGDSILVVEPDEAQREALTSEFGVRAAGRADAGLAAAALVVWAVKPQAFASAVPACRPFVGNALQLSVMAGIRTDAIARATGSERVIRAMPNTPALIGQGMAGLFARAAIDESERATAESVLASTGRLMWVATEDDLDALTAVSGSGPAYVFYVVEAMVDAAERMGLSARQGRELALATLAGSTALAMSSEDSLATLRERVTSKGGATHAAIECLEQSGVKAAFVTAMQACRQRARELGEEFSSG